MGHQQPGRPTGGHRSARGNGQSERQGTDAVVDSVRIADDRRRDVLRYLAVASPATVDDAAEQIAAWDRKTEPEAVAADQRERVRENLRRNHLPRLRACGLVEYDESDGTVALTDSGETVVGE